MCVCINEGIDTNDDNDDNDDDQKSGDADSNYGRPGSSALLTSLD